MLHPVLLWMVISVCRCEFELHILLFFVLFGLPTLMLQHWLRLFFVLYPMHLQNHLRHIALNILDSGIVEHPELRTQQNKFMLKFYFPCARIPLNADLLNFWQLSKNP